MASHIQYDLQKAILYDNFIGLHLMHCKIITSFKYTNSLISGVIGILYVLFSMYDNFLLAHINIKYVSHLHHARYPPKSIFHNP